jgi:hypothetical protein
MLVHNFIPDANFWELYPIFYATGPTKDLYEEDSSRDKKESSKIMWFVAFCYDQSPNNIYRNLEKDEKHELIGTDYMGNSEFYEDNKETLDPIIDHYCRLSDTSAAERQLRMWGLKMDEKTALMKKTEYTVESAEFLEKIMGTNVKLYADYERIKKEFEKQGDSAGKAKGDKLSSLSDTGQI